MIQNHVLAYIGYYDFGFNPNKSVMITNRFYIWYIEITGYKMNNEYRTLTKALEVVGF